MQIPEEMFRRFRGFSGSRELEDLVAQRPARAQREFFKTPAAGLVVAVLLAAVAVFWAPPLGSSLWLDETGTVWAIRGSLADTLSRAYDHPGQPSVLFSVLAWVTVAIGGLHEITLRLPSLAGCLIAAFGVYRLGLRFMEAEQALFASGIFILTGTIIFAASDARPYGLALMAVVWSMVMLVCWCDTSRPSYGIGWALLAALSIALHYLCSVTVLIHLAYLAGPRRSRLPRHFWKIAALFLLALTPLIPHAAHLWRLRAEHSFAGTPPMGDVAVALIPFRVLAGMVLGALLARTLTSRPLWSQPLGFTREQVFFGAWHLLPILLVVLISFVSDAKLFVPRYYVWSVPGLALLTASVTNGIRPARARTVVMACVFAALICRPIKWGPSAHGGEDWRGALHAAGRALAGESVLMLRIEFPEPHPGDLASATMDDPDLAPLAMYSVSQAVVSAPIKLDAEDRRRLEKVISDVLRRGAGLVFVSREQGVPVGTWLLGRFSGTGYQASTLGQFDGLTGLIFAPPGPAVTR